MCDALYSGGNGPDTIVTDRGQTDGAGIQRAWAEEFQLGVELTFIVVNVGEAVYRNGLTAFNRLEIKLDELAAQVSIVGIVHQAIATIVNEVFCDDKDISQCSIILEDDSLVSWGEFELTDLKILRLNRVLSDVIGKVPAPHNIDLKHFAIGKIFISEL